MNLIMISLACYFGTFKMNLLTPSLWFAMNCIFDTQPAKEFRPPMSEIVDSLVSFMQKLNVSKSVGGLADGTELDPLDRSFRTTTSRFIPSPSLSYVSA